MAARLGIQLVQAHRATDDSEAALKVLYAFAKDPRVPKGYAALVQEQPPVAPGRGAPHVAQGATDDRPARTAARPEDAVAAGGDDNPDDGKRRLPVLQPREPSPREPHAKEGDDLGELGLLDRSLPGDEEDNRPPWHWIGFGAAATFFAWLPLSALAGFATIRIAGGGPRRISPATGVWLVAAHTLAFVIAVPRGLPRRAGSAASPASKEAALGGAGAGGLAWGIAVARHARGLARVGPPPRRDAPPRGRRRLRGRAHRPARSQGRRGCAPG
ncbi:MAG: hypothetical protein R3F14_34605 [Polyangiaceae bacterium]